MIVSEVTLRLGVEIGHDAMTENRLRQGLNVVDGDVILVVETAVSTAWSRGRVDKGEPKECGELLHASPELQDFLVEARRAQVRHVQAHHDLRCLAEPPTGRRARDSEIRGDGHVPGALDEIPKAVVVTVLRAGRGRHGHDHRPFPHAAQLLEDDGERPPP